MEISFFSIVFQVIRSPIVIGTVIFVFLYIAFASFVVRYKKKPSPVAKKPKRAAVVASPEPDESADDSGGDEAEETSEE